MWIKNAPALYRAKYPNDKYDVYGWCEFAECRIYVDESLKQNIMRGCEVLLHEWIHAGHEFMGLDDKSNEEQYTELGARIWVSYMKNNPEVFEFLLKHIK